MKKDNFAILTQIINKHDPVNLISSGAPVDEYEDEAKEIMVRVNDNMTVNQVKTIITSIFIRNFNEETVGEYNFELIAKEIVTNLEKKPNEQR